MQFKILHFITATREKLLQRNRVESDVYTFCNEQIKTLPHLSVECEVVKLFWIDLQLWLYERKDILVNLNVREIIVGFQDTDFIMFNAVYLLAKKCILRCSYESSCFNLAALNAVFYKEKGSKIIAIQEKLFVYKCLILYINMANC